MDFGKIKLLELVQNILKDVCVYVCVSQIKNGKKNKINSSIQDVWGCEEKQENWQTNDDKRAQTYKDSVFLLFFFPPPGFRCVWAQKTHTILTHSTRHSLHPVIPSLFLGKLVTTGQVLS